MEKVHKGCCGTARGLECKLVIEYETVGRVAERWVYVVLDNHAFQDPR